MMVAIPFLEGIEHEPLKVPVQKPDFSRCVRGLLTCERGLRTEECTP